VKIKFLRAYTVKAEGGATYKEGAVVDLPEASCEHFVSRGAAEYVKADTPVAKPPGPETVTTADTTVVKSFGRKKTVTEA